MHVIHKLLFFFRSSVKYKFGLSMFLNYLCTPSPLLPWIIERTLYAFQKCVTVNQECPIYTFMPQDNYGHAVWC